MHVFYKDTNVTEEELTWATGLLLVSGKDCGTAPLSESLGSGRAGRSCPYACTPAEQQSL